VQQPLCRKNCIAHDRACTRVTPQNLHGKEGVDGSSPSEGFHRKYLQIRMFCSLVWRALKSSRVRNGYTLRDWRASAGKRDIGRPLATRLIRAPKLRHPENLPAYGALILPLWARAMTPSLQKGVKRQER
jgi:hypothetical protein